MLSVKTRNFKETTLEALIHASTNIAIIPTAIRKHKESKIDGYSSSILEKTIGAIAYTTIFPFEIGLLIAEPRLFLAVGATNIVSLLNEINRKIKSGKPKRSINDRINDFFDKARYFKENYARLIGNGLKNTVKGATAYSLAYVVAGTMAIADYNLWPSRGQHFYESRVNVSIERCKLTTEQAEYNFDILGEMHFYNFSSSKFVFDYIRNINSRPDVLLREGVSGASSETIPVSEILLGIGSIPFMRGARADYPNPSTITYYENIPEIALERYVDGTREGVTNTENIVLGASGLVSILAAPAIYFFSVPQSLTGYPFYLANFFPKSAGIVHKRNEIMTRNSFAQFQETPGNMNLLVFGEDHVPGIKMEFQNYGKLECDKVF